MFVMMSRIVINGSGSAACRSLNFLCSFYDLSKYDTSLSLLSRLKDNDEECAHLFFLILFCPNFFLYHGLFVSDCWSMMYLRPTPPSSTLEKKKKK